MKNLGYFVAFTIGAATGSLATWYMLNEKYKRLAQEEIDSVKQAFLRNRMKQEEAQTPEESKQESEPEEENPNDELVDYGKKLAHQLGYSFDEEGDAEEELPPAVTNRVTTDSTLPPYVISPDQFGEFDDYDRVSLVFYSDHILVDENYEIIDDVDGVVGAESLNHFGEYEDDSVHVRNDRLKIDYEILLDPRTYAEIAKSRPYLYRED